MGTFWDGICQDGTIWDYGGCTGSCLACPSKTISAAGSYYVTHCKCMAGYTGNDGLPCTACTAGTYKTTVGSDSCTACPPLTSSPSGSVEVTNCKCMAGYTGGDPCAECSAGSYKATVGS